MDVVTIAVVSVILVSYLIGTLTARWIPSANCHTATRAAGTTGKDSCGFRRASSFQSRPLSYNGRRWTLIFQSALHDSCLARHFSRRPPAARVLLGHRDSFWLQRQVRT